MKPLQQGAEETMDRKKAVQDLCQFGLALD